MKKWILIIAVSAGWLACSNSIEKSKILPMAVEDFNAALVWKNVPVAASYVGGSDAAETMARIRKVSAKLKVVEVEPVETRMAPDGKSAICVVKFSWHTERDLTIRRGIEEQHWKLVDGRWRMLEQNAPEDDEESDPSPFVRDKPEKEKKQEKDKEQEKKKKKQE